MIPLEKVAVSDSLKKLKELGISVPVQFQDLLIRKDTAELIERLRPDGNGAFYDDSDGKRYAHCGSHEVMGDTYRPPIRPCRED